MTAKNFAIQVAVTATASIIAGLIVRELTKRDSSNGG